MAITLVQSVSQTTGATNSATIVFPGFGGTPGLGNVIIVAFSIKGSSITAGASLSGQSATTICPLFATIYQSNGTIFSGIAIIPVKQFAGNVVTIATTAATNVSMCGVAAEFSGINITPSQFAGASVNSATVSTGTITNTYANTLLVGNMVSRGSGFTAPMSSWLDTITGGFTSVAQTSTTVNTSNNEALVAMVYRTTTSISSWQATGNNTIAPNWNAGMLTSFREAPTGTGGAFGG